MDEKKEETLRVNDRRRFTSEGETKEAEPEVKAEIKEPAAEVKTSKANPEAGPDQEIDFSSFVVSFATQALVLMGEIPHPETGERVQNLDAAKQTVDILGILDVKTKGNLTELEQKLMDEVLASVRLAFVNASNSK